MLKKTLRALREYPWVILFALFILLSLIHI